LVNITLFLAFLASLLNGEGSLTYFFYIDFITTEFFFNIDLLPPDLGLASFLTSALSSPSPKFYLIYLLITIWLLPKILCWLPSSESESFLIFSFIASVFYIDFLLLLITRPSIPCFDILSNFDRLCWFTGTLGSYFGNSKDGLLRQDFLAVLLFTLTLWPWDWFKLKDFSCSVFPNKLFLN